MKIHWGRILLAILFLFGLGGGCVYFTWPLIQPMLPKPLPTVAAAPTNVPVAQATAAPKATTLPNVVPTKIPEILKPTQSNLPVVRVAMPSFAPYLVPVMGDMVGVYTKRGIRVEFIFIGMDGQNNADEELQAEWLRTNKVQVLFTTSEKVVSDPTVGKVVTITDQTLGADKFVCQKRLTLDQLPDKKIAYAKGSIGEFFAQFILNLQQIPLSKVTMVPQPDVPTAVQMFVDGKVDCVSGWTPDINPALEKGVDIINSRTVRVPIDAIVFSPDSAKRPTEMQAFMDGYFESLKILTENPDMAEEAILKFGHSDWTFVEKKGDWIAALNEVGLASLVDNELYFVSDTSALISRLSETQAILEWAGRASKVKVAPESLFDPSYIKNSATKADLRPKSASDKLNFDFLLTSKSKAPNMKAVDLGSKATTLAVLPFKDVKFQPDSTILTAEDKANIKKYIAPVLLSSDTIYLKLTGSAAWPNDKYTADGIQAYGLERAQAVQKFLISPEVNIHPSRIIVTSVRPAKVMNVDEQAKARFVQFELIVEGR